MTNGEFEKRIDQSIINEKTEFSCMHEVMMILGDVRKEFLELAPEIKDPDDMKALEELVKLGRANGYVKLVVALKKWFFAV